MKKLLLSLPRWSAWAPDLEQKEAWLAWASEKHPSIPTGVTVPDVTFLPASLRRRCSKISKMLLYNAFALATKEQLSVIPVVIASQGGESETTLTLLEQIAQGELSSPMKFSLSVHNASAGLLSMASSNVLPSTTIAAGNKTFAAGLLESLTQLESQKLNELVFLGGDELLPPVMSNAHVEMKYHYGSGFLFTRADSAPQLSFEYCAAEENFSEANVLPQPFQFIHWLLSEQNELLLRGSGFQLKCVKLSNGYRDAFAQGVQ